MKFKNFLSAIFSSMCLVSCFCLICFALCFGLTACGKNYNNANESIKSVCGDYFVQIKEWEDFKIGSFTIVYAKDTKVKYLIWHNTYGGGITPLYNADGSLQVYEEEEK